MIIRKKIITALLLAVAMIIVIIGNPVQVLKAASNPMWIQISPKDLHMKIGDQIKLQIAASTPSILKQSEFVWKSSKEKYVTVSKTGVITAIAAGKSKITVEAKNKGTILKADCFVNGTEIKDIQIDASDMKNGTVSLKNDTFNTVTIKNNISSGNIYLSGITIKNAINIEEGSNCSLSLSASTINKVNVKNTYHIDDSAMKANKTKQPLIALSKKTNISEVNLKKDISISADNTSSILTLNVLPDKNQNLYLSLKGLKNKIVVNGMSNSSVTSILDDCTIKLADIITDDQPFKVTFKNKVIESPNSKILKLQTEPLIQIDMGISSDQIMLNQETAQSNNFNNSSAFIKNTTLTIHDKAVIKEIINNLNGGNLVVESGSVNEYTINSNHTNTAVSTIDAFIGKITVHGDYAAVTGIGRIPYVKLKGNNSNVFTNNTRVETGSNTSGNYAGTYALKAMDSVINSTEMKSQSQERYVTSSPARTPSPIRLAAPSNLKVIVNEDIFSFSWNSITSASKYLFSIYNKSNEVKIMEQTVIYPSYATTLPTSGSAVQIRIKAIGDGKRFIDSQEEIFDIDDEGTPIPPTPPATKVVIKDCKLESVTSKKISSTDTDKEYKLSLNLSWDISGSAPDSYHVYIKNISSNFIESVAVTDTTSLRLNQYITKPDTNYEITVVPVNEDREGAPSNVYTYASPPSACSHTEDGCFLWNDNDLYGNPVFGITTPEQMEHIKIHYDYSSGFSNYVVFVQLNDIDFAGKSYQNSIAGNLRMAGVIYDGQGFMIDNFTVNVSSGIGGVFAYFGLNNSTIKDFGIGTQAYIISTGGTDSVGSITGELYGTLTRSYSYAAVRANTSKHVGGMIGQNAHGIDNSYFAGSVTNEGTGPVGGIAGIANRYVLNSYNIGSVNGNGLTGGIAGTVTDAPINTCYNLNYPNGPAGQTGGLAGTVTGRPMIKGFTVSSDNTDVLVGTPPGMDGTSKKISITQFQDPEVISYLNSSKFVYNHDKLRPEIIDNRQRF